MIEFMLSDGSFASLTDYVQAIFNNVGDTGIETYSLNETGTNMGGGTVIPSLVRDGSNTFKLVKTGDNIRMYMNGTIMCNHNLENLTLTVFYPYLNVNAADSSQIRITGISFKYNGDYDTKAIAVVNDGVKPILMILKSCLRYLAGIIYSMDSTKALFS